MNFDRVLNSLSEFLERQSQPFVVVGGLALQAYGFARSTQNVDVTLAMSAQDLAISFLESLGYRTLHRSVGFSNHVHDNADDGRVDVIYVDDATLKAFRQGPLRAIRLGENVFYVPRPEHLIAMKINAMKNNPQRTFRELADIQFLMGLPGVDSDEWALPVMTAEEISLNDMPKKPMSFEEYLTWLESLPQATTRELESRGIIDSPPFHLE